MTDLSPAAKDVLDAVQFEVNAECDARWIAAAAIRAVADQVVPVEVHPEVYEDCCQYSDVKTRAGIRAAILAIATELENQP